MGTIDICASGQAHTAQNDRHGKRTGSTTIAPAGDRPFHHSYKNLLLPATVDVMVDGESIRYSGNIGGIDFSKGYPPRHTFWNWASLNAKTENGVEFGINLVRRLQ
jgi:hypothetical protein